jgi:hypothetical protein
MHPIKFLQVLFQQAFHNAYHIEPPYFIQVIQVLYQQDSDQGYKI